MSTTNSNNGSNGIFVGMMRACCVCILLFCVFLSASCLLLQSDVGSECDSALSRFGNIDLVNVNAGKYAEQISHSLDYAKKLYPDKRISSIEGFGSSSNDIDYIVARFEPHVVTERIEKSYYFSMWRQVDDAKKDWVADFDANSVSVLVLQEGKAFVSANREHPSVLCDLVTSADIDLDVLLRIVDIAVQKLSDNERIVQVLEKKASFQVTTRVNHESYGRLLIFSRSDGQLKLIKIVPYLS